MNIAILTKKLVVRPKKIPLSQGKFALVDPEDYEYLSQFKWFAFTTRWSDHSNQPTFYSARTIYFPNGYKYNLRMHQAILGAPLKGLTIDHIDRNGLNNCRSNLRICTLGQNCANTRNYDLKKGRKESPYRGVYRVGKVTKTWAAEIRHERKMIYLGRYKTDTDAAIAYDKKALELKGKFATTNFNW